MARLDLRFDKRSLGGDLKLGVVARIQQIKDADGKFPSDPVGREVVIPAGTQATRTVDLPLGTYHIEARLPSGQVLRETRKVTDEQHPAAVVFDAGHSPHEWLSWQRLAGNVPSQAEYEAWVGKLAEQIKELAKAKSDAAKPIQIDQAAVRRWAQLLHDAHVKYQPILKSVGELVDKAIAGVSDTLTMGHLVLRAPAPEPPAAVEPAEFELLQADPLHAELFWDTVASMRDWTAWRQTAQPDDTLAVARNDDRQVTLWQITQRDRTRRVTAPSGKRVPMRSLAVMQRGNGVDVIPLPVPWPLNAEMAAATIEILREAGTSDAGRTTLTVRDEIVGSLIMYLNNGQISDAAAVLAEAERDNLIEGLISDKVDNPFAACAAAYVGLATMSGDDTPPRWTNWLGNLMNFFEWLPDGAIIRAAHLLKTAKTHEDLDTALESFKTAYRRGIPFYSAGLQHLMNGLYMFSEKDADAKAKHEKVSAVASRVDRDRAFTQITIAASPA